MNLHIRVLNGFDNWMWRRYDAACKGPRWWWRIWFELTGQGRQARHYMRIVSKGRDELIARYRATDRACPDPAHPWVCRCWDDVA